jgi:hypothetical protein
LVRKRDDHPTGEEGDIAKMPRADKGGSSFIGTPGRQIISLNDYRMFWKEKHGRGGEIAFDAESTYSDAPTN